MTEPLEYRAVLRLVENLRQIDPSRGFFSHVEDVAVKLDPDQSLEELIGVYPAIVLMPGNDETWQYEPGSQAIASIPWRLVWVASARTEEPSGSGLEDGGRMLAYWRACRDVLKVFIDDVTLGGLVTELRITNRAWNREIDGLDVHAVIDFTMRTRRDFTSPGGY